MPVLPLIDLLILLGWSSLFIGATLKAIWITTSYQPTILTLSPIDFLWIAAAFLLVALSLGARTWVKLNEGRTLSLARSRRVSPGVESAQEHEDERGRFERPLPVQE